MSAATVESSIPKLGGGVNQQDPTSSSSAAQAPPNLLAITLMGHVDHGKSSYADSLLASNGLISQRQAGKIRYLDSREDEQERGITIESSGVRLGFKIKRSKDAPEPEDWTLNLIDTPGHIDFSSEVSTSSRLVDGCLILVDVLEGVCTQTVNVLRQAWIDRLKPILVLNKIDRLAAEVRMSPAEAEAQLQRVIEQANATLAGFWAEERMQDEEREREAAEARGEEFKSSNAQADQQEGEEEADAELYFDPARGNVIFASSLYGFAFRLHSFSHLYSQKLGLPEDKFRTFLWGEWFFDGKGKRMLNRKQATKLWGEGRLGPTACQQFVLDNVWRVFEKTVVERDQETVDKIVKTLGLPIPARELKNPDSHALLSSILSAWLPLAPCTFSTLVDQIPPPAIAQGRRIPRILDPEGHVWKSEQSRFYANKIGLPAPQGRTPVERDLFSASREQSAWRVGVISKMFAVASEDLPTATPGAPKKAAADGGGAREKQATERSTASKEGSDPASSGGDRHDIRNLSIEERRQRAREARERHEAARAAQDKAILQADSAAVQQAATGGASDTAQSDRATALQGGVAVSGGIEQTQQAPSELLGTAPAVAIDATYVNPVGGAPNGDQTATASTSTPEAEAEAESEPSSSEVLLAFVRVYSGSLAATTSLSDSHFFLLMPKYNPALPPTHASNAKHLKRVHIQDIYVIMGKELVKVSKVEAGEICAVRGLEGIVGRMGTLVAVPEAETQSLGAATGESDSALAERTATGFVNLTGGAGLAAPIVRVALEPDNPADMPRLVEGLRLLNQSDPCVQTLVQETGEHVIVTAGELHLERCLKDLRERFAKVPLSASKPLVPFRETAIRVSEMAPSKLASEGEPRGTVRVSVHNGAVKLKVRAKPLPETITDYLEANATTIRSLLDRKVGGGGGDAHVAWSQNNRKQKTGDDSAGPDDGEDASISRSSNAARGGSATATATATATAPKAVPGSQFFETLDSLLQRAGSTAKAWDQEWREAGLVDRIWSFGPRRVGPNLLLGPPAATSESEEAAAGQPVSNRARGLRSRLVADAARGSRSGAGSGLPTPGGVASSKAAAHDATATAADAAEELAGALQRQANLEDGGEKTRDGDAGEANRSEWTSQDLLDCLDAGFQMAVLAGPMCAEPVRGLAYFVSDLDIDWSLVASQRLRLTQVTGPLISSVREACRSALLDWSPRLMLAMYECDVQASPEVLGKVHAVLARRRGKVVGEEMRDGTSYFTVTAWLPAVESFGFADEVRKRTSGAASPQLVFRGFETFDLDPFWVPRTEEELEDLGEKGERENTAKRYMDAVRRRKGMKTDERIVEAAEKQRNLKSN
ncbi:unnamed protein product [Parajaminaea phylloscopi]